ncbi:metallopeptidase family protein [Zhihengliuella halotolerans]|uniref:Zinicin-like metallopeptidase n=1 Tax=Zhihengliuella halotolerans TaxID=370736 RepID=A0A4Q8AEF7_9MICC|nr:metallopeptidase family protein [Zhihengliuella halotolerans]RZU62085.1 zinicin-like metallopeptidase [Zhihengliuella halotolerans]
MGSFTFDSGPEHRPSGGRGFHQRRRNRHGRGMRGPMMPLSLPGARTRQDRFEDLVAESSMRLEQLHGTRIASIQFMVAFAPDKPGLDRATARGEATPLGRSLRVGPQSISTPEGQRSVAGQQQVVLFRRPIEELSPSPAELPELVHDVVIELVAELLNLSPEQVDSTYGRSHLRGP